MSISSSLSVCQVTYGSFDYTSLLYLSDYGSDFTGGRFVFMDPNGNRTVEPRAGTYQPFVVAHGNTLSTVYKPIRPLDVSEARYIL